MNQKLADIQPGYRKGRETRDQIADIHWIIEKAKEFQKNIYFCFIDLPLSHLGSPHRPICRTFHLSSTLDSRPVGLLPYLRFFLYQIPPHISQPSSQGFTLKCLLLVSTTLSSYLHAFFRAQHISHIETLYILYDLLPELNVFWELASFHLWIPVLRTLLNKWVLTDWIIKVQFCPRFLVFVVMLLPIEFFSPSRLGAESGYRRDSLN